MDRQGKYSYLPQMGSASATFGNQFFLFDSKYSIGEDVSLRFTEPIFRLFSNSSGGWIIYLWFMI